MTSNKYEVMFNPNEETALVRITAGKFNDFVYQYKRVSVGDFEEENSEVKLSFEYELKSAPESYVYEDEEADKKEFEHTIGDVLFDIITNSDKVKEVINGIDNTKQSD